MKTAYSIPFLVLLFATSAAAVCGDGAVTGDETCDDSNTTRGDGCSAECQTEVELDKAAQACLNLQNKDAAKLGKVFSSAVLTPCVESFLAGENTDLYACMYAALNDLTNAYNKTAAKIEPAIIAACTVQPAFGPPEPASVFNAFLISYLNVLLQTDAGMESATEADSVCRLAAHKNIQKLLTTRFSLFNKCKKAGISGKTSPQMVSGADLEVCVTALPDSSGKVGKSEQKLAGALAKSCASVTAGTFLDPCGSEPSTAEMASCMADRVECIWCLELNTGDGLSVDCDLLDNGADDGSCEP